MECKGAMQEREDVIEGLYFGDYRMSALVVKLFDSEVYRGRMKVEFGVEENYSEARTIRAVTSLNLDSRVILRSVWEGKYREECGLPRLDGKASEMTVKMKDCPEADLIFEELKKACGIK